MIDRWILDGTNLVNLRTREATVYVPPSSSPRFVGDPGLGNYYVGGRADTLTWTNNETAFDNWETAMQPYAGGKQACSIERIYDGTASVSGGLNSGVRSSITAAYAANRLPHVSFKLPSGVTNADAGNATGSFETWMDNLAAYFTSLAPKPIWWTFFHEPENDLSIWGDSTGADGTLQQYYRQACRNIKNALDTRGVTNSWFWTTGYMCPFSFGKASSGSADGAGARDWRHYYPDWKGTTQSGSSKNNPNPADFYIYGVDSQAVVQGIGLDIYNWWSEGAAKSSYVSFWDLFRHAYSRTSFLGRPYNTMEHGTLVYHTGSWSSGTDAAWDNQLALDYLSAMYNNMIQYDIVACQVFNYAIVEQQFRLEQGDPSKTRYQGYGLGMARANHIQPTF